MMNGGTGGGGQSQQQMMMMENQYRNSSSGPAIAKSASGSFNNEAIHIRDMSAE